MRRLLSFAASVAILAAFAVPLQTESVAAQSSLTYSWSVDCKGTNSVDAEWTWLHNGAPLGTTQFGSCGLTVIGLPVPSGANGITATLGVLTDCGADTTGPVTKSFDPSKGVSLALHASVSSCHFFGITIAPAAADFKLST